MSSKTKRQSSRTKIKSDVNIKSKLENINSNDEDNGNDNDCNKIESTPPKQKKVNSVPQNTLSPGTGAASLILKLKLNSNKDEMKTGVHELTNKAKNNKYQKARQILNTNETNKLPGREKEYNELIEFLIEHCNSKKSGSLYISGPPGTGKTACLTKLLKSPDVTNKFKKIYINCTSVTSINNVYRNICEELKLELSTATKGKEIIENYLMTNHKMILLVLDEIDQLISKRQSILYSIFEWPTIQNSKIILIGIANALDLTDRMLPRLNTKLNLKPKLMHFSPYTKQQIIDIFTDRLKEANVLELFPPVTIQLLAGKVAAISGDVRRALDIGRRVIEITEKQQSLNTSKIIDLADLGITPLDDNQSTPVELKQVVSVINNIYGTSQNLNDDIEDSFPLQQKILICALLLILKHDKNKDITIGRLHDVYKKVCKKRNILSVDQSEFVGICDLVETRGIIKLQKKKEPRQCKVGLEWDEEEVNQALRDKQLISSILSDTTCLQKN